MSLLKITTTPIEYEIKIERAKLRAKEQDVAEIKREQVAQIRKQQQTAQYKTDPSIVKEAQRAAQSNESYKSIARSRVVSSGVRSTTSAEITKASGQAITSDDQLQANQVSFNSVLTSVLSFSDKYDSSDFVEKFDMSKYVGNTTSQPDSWTNAAWTASKREMEFVPGRFQMEITQYPKVTIEYLGNQEDIFAE